MDDKTIYTSLAVTNEIGDEGCTAMLRRERDREKEQDC